MSSNTMCREKATAARSQFEDSPGDKDLHCWRCGLCSDATRMNCFVIIIITMFDGNRTPLLP